MVGTGITGILLVQGTGTIVVHLRGKMGREQRRQVRQVNQEVQYGWGHLRPVGHHHARHRVQAGGHEVT